LKCRKLEKLFAIQTREKGTEGIGVSFSTKNRTKKSLQFLKKISLSSFQHRKIKIFFSL